MKITIKDKKYEQENYECIIYVDGKKQDIGRAGSKEINCEKMSEVKIEYINKILKEKNVAVLGVFYWVLSVLTGTNSPHPFGLPFNSVLRIKCIDDKDIIIEVNDDWKKTPFQIKGNCSIIENYFISPKGYKKKWLFLEVLPIFILMSLVFLLFFLVLEGIEELYILKTLFWSVVIISEIAWCMYVYKVLKK